MSTQDFFISEAFDEYASMCLIQQLVVGHEVVTVGGKRYDQLAGFHNMVADSMTRVEQLTQDRVVAQNGGMVTQLKSMFDAYIGFLTPNEPLGDRIEDFLSKRNLLASMQDEFKPLGIRSVRTIQADGNCFYRAFLCALEKRPELWKKIPGLMPHTITEDNGLVWVQALREMVARHLQENRGDYEDCVEDLDGYIQDVILKDCAYAEGLVCQVLPELFDVMLHVHEIREGRVVTYSFGHLDQECLGHLILQADHYSLGETKSKATY